MSDKIKIEIPSWLKLALFIWACGTVGHFAFQIWDYVVEWINPTTAVATAQSRP